MDKQRTVTCDKCNQPFAPELKAEPVLGGGELQYFTCPYCGHRYEVAFITDKGLELRARLQDYLHALQGKQDPYLERRCDKVRALYQAEVHSRLPVR